MSQKAVAKKVSFAKKVLTKGAIVAPLESLEPKAKLTDIAYEKIEEAIVTLKLAPGVARYELRGLRN